MIKDNQGIGGKGTGGTSVTGTQNRVDSSPTTLEAGVTEQTKGGDPYTAHKPGAVPGHMSELNKHSGAAVVKGGSSQAGSVGGYEGK